MLGFLTVKFLAASAAARMTPKRPWLPRNKTC